MENNIAIHDEIKTGFCEGCKGQRYMEDSGCYETCSGYANEYAEIKREWANEL